MSARMWAAVKELAEVWRSSDFLQRYATAALGSSSGAMYPSAPHIYAQPFYLCEYIHTAVDFSQPRQSHPWIDDGAQLAVGYTALFEWLRSRLVGYPFAEMPQLSPVSPWTRMNVSMKVPWLPELSAWELQHRATPPVIPELSVDRDAQLSAGAGLAEAIATSPAATNVVDARQRLSSADIAQLVEARAAVDRAQYPERPNQTLGGEDFRQLAWAETQLDTALSQLTGDAATFADALNRADTILQQAAALFSQLIFYGKIRRLAPITHVEQPDGIRGWHTVQCDRFIVPPIRQSEIVAFDSQYPKALMLVEGAHDQMPFGSYDGRVTLHGPLLPDSLDWTSDPDRYEQILGWE